MARRALILALLLSLGAAAPAAASRYVAPNGSGALFLFSGHGWGHGVGMSQYGAYGFAQHGFTYDQILAHYYPGTRLAKAPLATIRVLLQDRRTKLTISSTSGMTVTDGTGATHTLAAGKVTFGPKLLLAVDGGAAAALPAPLSFAPAAAAGTVLTLGRAYRGRILVDVVDGRLRAIDVLPLQQYLYGVVPAEMPSGWSAEALKAQAVASRSYALATRAVAAPFDVYGDTRSQAYLGVTHETPASNAAVDATAGQVLMYGKKIATTYFSSTSGGQTESAADAWGGVGPPYLVSVDDPYDAISPYHDWGPVPVTAQTIAAKLKVPGTVEDATTTPNEAGRVATLDVSSLAGKPATATVTQVLGSLARAKLGLRSTWFDVGVLTLLPPATATVVYGTPVTLNGLVRGVDGVVVEQRSANAAWSELEPVAPADDGTISLVTTPELTTDYRLATPDLAAAYVRVKVVPQVTLTSLTSSLASGTVLPALPGAAVQIQQQNPVGAAPAWTTVVTGIVDENGAFAVPVSLAPGTYRALVAPGHGFSPGASSVATLAP
ncbi:MAG TPA: SpoIID/LytB domain-containing protein [Gaiellaceae bacterium]|nr:SpoIID/LytB domain-containing protein [Gaiellaceae bacterium]